MTQGCKRSYDSKHSRYGCSDEPHGNLLRPKKAGNKQEKGPWSGGLYSPSSGLVHFTRFTRPSWWSHADPEKAPGQSQKAEEEHPGHDQKAWSRKWDDRKWYKEDDKQKGSWSSSMWTQGYVEQDRPTSCSEWSDADPEEAADHPKKAEEEDPGHDKEEKHSEEADVPSDWGWVRKWDKENAKWYWHDGDHTFAWVKPTGPSECSKKKAEENYALTGCKKKWDETLRRWFWYPLVGVELVPALVFHPAKLKNQRWQK